MATGAQPRNNTYQVQNINLHMLDNDGLDDTSVVKAGVDFEVWLAFSGSGINFIGMTHATEEFTINYYVEAKGNFPHPGPFAKTNKLISNQTAYGKAETSVKVRLNTPGLYEITAIVTFKNYKGYTIFADGLIVEALDE